MKKIISGFIGPISSGWLLSSGLLFLRITLSLELIIVHGLKKLGIGVMEEEKIPNPFHLYERFNNDMALLANLVFPVLVLFGLFTRLATLPILVVTLTGYFIVHWKDSLLISDVPFMYSIAFISILIMGPGKYSLDKYLFKT